jgi:Rrf2 family transcriptional regulator, iron-sulfur cluster assembly transcription factor
MLAIAAVVDVALHSKPVRSKSLAARHNLLPRHLEVVLQALVHAKILESTRGPQGGYKLPRDRPKITVGDIVRVALTLTTGDSSEIGASSVLLKTIVEPRVRKAGEGFLSNLDAINVEDLRAAAIAEGFLEDDADLHSAPPSQLPR